MLINAEKCIGCGKCVPYCPMNAIEIAEKKAVIVFDECVECGVCKRVECCPVDAIYQQPLEWPRSVRAVYSDPLNVHKETGLAGRGTEETKTNDVTGRFKKGEFGIALELGRPGIGARLRELEKLTVALAQNGFRDHCALNPLTNLLNLETGEIPPELREEKVLSAIIEFSVKEHELLDALKVIKETAATLDTVFSCDVAVRGQEGKWITSKILEDAGIYYRPNAKINIGLGKPYVD